MKNKDNLKSIFQTVCFFMLFLLLITKEASAEHLFQTQNTWYEKIPANPVLFNHSSDHIQDILINGNHFGAAYGEWSVPIYYAPPETAKVKVELDNPSSPYCGGHSTQYGWNVVPIPSGALPAGNAARCAGDNRDGHMVVYNDKYVWEFYKARKCKDGIWRANCVRQYDRSGDGIVSPYDNWGECRACPGAALTHGTVRKSEIDAGVIDHALTFCYWGEGPTLYKATYPCEDTRGIVSTRTYAMHIGMRIQLNPSVDCNSLGLNNFGKVICKALQDYGAIFVDNCGKGYNSIYIENRANGAQALGDWSNILGDISAIPISQMRVVKPVCSNCSICPNCTGETNAPPAPPFLNEVK